MDPFTCFPFCVFNLLPSGFGLDLYHYLLINHTIEYFTVNNYYFINSCLIFQNCIIN